MIDEYKSIESHYKRLKYICNLKPKISSYEFDCVTHILFDTPTMETLLKNLITAYNAASTPLEKEHIKNAVKTQLGDEFVKQLPSEYPQKRKRDDNMSELISHYKTLKTDVDKSTYCKYIRDNLQSSQYSLKQFNSAVSKLTPVSTITPSKKRKRVKSTVEKPTLLSGSKWDNVESLFCGTVRKDCVPTDEARHNVCAIIDRYFKGTLTVPDYQITAIDFLLNTERAVYADDMGLGKTIVMIVVGAYRSFQTKRPSLILVPENGLKNQTINSIFRFLPSLSKDRVIDFSTPSRHTISKEQFDNAVFVLCNHVTFKIDFSTFSPWYFDPVSKEVVQRPVPSQEEIRILEKEWNDRSRHAAKKWQKIRYPPKRGQDPKQSSFNTALYEVLTKIRESRHRILEMKRYSFLFSTRFAFTAIDEGDEARCNNEYEKCEHVQKQLFLAIYYLDSDYKALITGSPVNKSVIDALSIYRCINITTTPVDLSIYAMRRIQENPEIQEQCLKMGRYLPKTKYMFRVTVPDEIECKIFNQCEASFLTASSSVTNDNDMTQNKVFSAINAYQRATVHPYLITGECSNICDKVKYPACGKEIILYKDVGNILKEGKKAIIFTQYIESARRIAYFINEYYGKGVACAYSSDVSAKIRNSIIASFKRGDCNILVGTKAMMKGLDLSEAKYILQYSLLYNPADIAQAVKRAARMTLMTMAMITKYKAGLEWYDTSQDVKIIRYMSYGSIEMWIMNNIVLPKAKIGSVIYNETNMYSADVSFSVNLSQMLSKRGIAQLQTCDNDDDDDDDPEIDLKSIINKKLPMLFNAMSGEFKTCRETAIKHKDLFDIMFQ